LLHGKQRPYRATSTSSVLVLVPVYTHARGCAGRGIFDFLYEGRGGGIVKYAANQITANN
jgi:hypothetical protein